MCFQEKSCKLAQHCYSLVECVVYFLVFLEAEVVNLKGATCAAEILCNNSCVCNVCFFVYPMGIRTRRDEDKQFD